MTLIDTDDLVEELEHEIITIDGITMLIPTLLASDVAHDLLIEYDSDENIPYEHIKYDCAEKLDEIFAQMVKRAVELIEENGYYTSSIDMVK